MTSPGRGRRLLVVDDAAEVRMLLRAVLELGGFVVEEAPDGESGLAAARQEPPDLVLLDVQLPGLDGPDVLRALQADPGTGELPVVFLTASPPQDDASLLALGARGVLRKPFSPLSIADEVAALLP